MDAIQTLLRSLLKHDGSCTHTHTYTHTYILDYLPHYTHQLSENVVVFSGNRNFEFTIVMYHPDNGQRSYKPQAKHAERMILPSSSQKHLRTYH